jgi:peptide/nickel transport system substrate-binding protein
MTSRVFRSINRTPMFAMQKRISGYRYWFHRQMDYRTLVKA